MAKTSTLMMLALPLTILVIALLLNNTGLLSAYIDEGFSDTNGIIMYMAALIMGVLGLLFIFLAFMR
jgi:hypothetical protein